MTLRLKIYYLINFTFLLLSTISNTLDFTKNENQRVYLNTVKGPNCPFSGAWLAHIDLFNRSQYVLSDTMLEKAMFKVSRLASIQYRVSDYSLYNVNHMSQFEHCIRKNISEKYQKQNTSEIIVNEKSDSCKKCYDK